MTRREHLLVIAMEECAEVAQRVSKALRFGLEEIQAGQPFTNRQGIEYEFVDLCTVLEMAGLIDLDFEGQFCVDATMQGEKQRKVETYLRYSASVGCLSKDHSR